MALKVTQSGGEFELLPAGQYIARCYKIIDLGTQDVTWLGETKKQQKVMIYWEILDDKVKMEDGRPFSISRKYTASLNEKSNLYSDLVAWRGRDFTEAELAGFDMSKLLGAYCQMQVIHNESNGKTYANVNTIMATKDRPAAVNPDVMFDIDSPDMTVFEAQSEWLKDQIRKSPEWQARESDSDISEIDTLSKPIGIDKVVDVDPDEEINIDDIPF